MSRSVKILSELFNKIFESLHFFISIPGLNIMQSNFSWSIFFKLILLVAKNLFFFLSSSSKINKWFCFFKKLNTYKPLFPMP